jgi:hypothetical protein
MASRLPGMNSPRTEQTPGEHVDDWARYNHVLELGQNVLFLHAAIDAQLAPVITPEDVDNVVYIDEHLNRRARFERLKGVELLDATAGNELAQIREVVSREAI